MVDQALYRKFSNKRVNAANAGIECNLTFEDYQLLLEEAGITHEDVGNKGYHLARYNDTGPYEIGNCRFVHYLVNLQEKKVSEKQRRACRQNILDLLKNRTFEERSRIGKIAGKSGGGHNKFSDQEVQQRISMIENAGINLKEYGWVGKVARLWGISHTQVRTFINKYYHKPYYRRKSVGV